MELKIHLFFRSVGCVADGIKIRALAADMNVTVQVPLILMTRIMDLV